MKSCNVITIFISILVNIMTWKNWFHAFSTCSMTIVVAGFLCSGDCYLPETPVEEALFHILTTVGSTVDMARTLLPFLEINTKWADCLDKKQVKYIVQLKYNMDLTNSVSN